MWRVIIFISLMAFMFVVAPSHSSQTERLSAVVLTARPVKKLPVKAPESANIHFEQFEFFKVLAGGRHPGTFPIESEPSKGQSVAAQGQVTKANRQLLDLRFNPVMDLSHMVRKYASSKLDLPKNIDGFEEAVAVARQLNTEFGSWAGGGWPTLDAVLAKSKNSTEAMQALSQAPETVTSRQGKTIRFRDSALRYSKALNAIEASYLKNVRPQHESLVNNASAYIAKTFQPEAQKCFAYLRSSLGFADPQSGIPVFLVAETPWPGAFTFWDASRKGTVVISIESNPGSLLLEALLHEAIHALDLEASGNGNVLEEIRTRLKKAGMGENDLAVVQGAHLLVFIQAGETVRRLFDPSHQHYGDVRGVYQRGPLQPLANVARSVWVAYLDNKISREEALDKIVDGFLKVQKEGKSGG